ncbi:MULTISPECIES: aldolase/citrate lyase family protein [unclassified Xanthobacter]|uniref:aldolase/citrate lyase family protein n=1 Tax=unclassified Xanthobacter TaxID=2623496 RepID=UPI001EE02A34|nr:MULTISPECIES: aldolase/citrate lyase family protein [unclassified Xanthobacter]
MDLPVNSFKHAIAAGRPQIGLWCTLSNAYAAEIVAGSGFDWLLLDTEHSPNEIDTVLGQLQAVGAYPTTPIVRPAWNDPVLIKRFLDIGAQTLLLPYIQSVSEAERAVASMRYPPHGFRGVGGTTRATRFGRVKDYAARCESELCLLLQVETKTALDQLESIAGVEGVDGIFIGPADLSASLGFGGNASHPEVVKVVGDALRRIRATGRAAGVLATDPALVDHYLECGATFVAVGVDMGILARETTQLAARFKR